jgi:hypothetical protein
LSHPGAVGRLSQVCDRWIYTSCLCFGLDREEQRRSGFGYGYSVYQVGYSRNLLFGNGARMDRVFDTIVDRTRSRLDVPQLKTVFGAKARPRRDRASGPPRLEAALETPRYDLTIFKLHFGRLTLKAYTKGERVLRFEAITHNTAELRCGRALERFGEIVTRLAGMAERFTTMLDCVDIGFIPDQFLDRLPAPSQIGATRVGGIDLNRPRTRAALHAAAVVLDGLFSCLAGLHAQPDGLIIVVGAWLDDAHGVPLPDPIERSPVAALEERGEHRIVRLVHAAEPNVRLLASDMKRPAVVRWAALAGHRLKEWKLRCHRSGVRTEIPGMRGQVLPSVPVAFTPCTGRPPTYIGGRTERKPYTD